MEEKKEKLSLKRGMGSEARAALASNIDVDSQLLTPFEQQRQRYKQKKRTQGGRESAVCFCVKLLNLFVIAYIHLCHSWLLSRDASTALYSVRNACTYYGMLIPFCDRFSEEICLGWKPLVGASVVGGKAQCKKIVIPSL